MTPTLGSFVAARVVSSSSASSSLATRVCLSLHLRLLLFPGAHHHLPRAPVIRLPRRSASPGASSVLGNKHRHASFRGGFHHLRGVHFPPPLHLHPRPRLEHGRIRRLHRRPRRERLRRGVVIAAAVSKSPISSHSGAARGCSSTPRRNTSRAASASPAAASAAPQAWYRYLRNAPRADLRRPASTEPARAPRR